MGDEQQKLDEKMWFTRFMSMASIAGEFEQPATPSPDIVVPRLRLGVEITEAFHDAVAVQREGEEQTTLALAQQLYHEAGHPPVDVTVHWSAHHSPTRRSRRRLAQEIVQCVVEHLPANEPGRRVDLQHQDALPLVSLSLHRHRVPSEYAPYWRASRGAFPPHCDPQVIQERITDKAGKLADYRKYCDEVWLLVVASHAATASWCTNVEAIAESHEFDSAFDRTFFMVWPAELHELRCKR